MSYTPPLSEAQAKKGFFKFLEICFLSLIPLAVTIIAAIRLNKEYATFSAIFGVYASVFSVLTPETFLNPANLRIDFLNQPGVKKYFTIIFCLKAIPIILSIIFLVLDFVF